jgi:hypothetical protein
LKITLNAYLTIRDDLAAMSIGHLGQFVGRWERESETFTGAGLIYIGET